MEQLRKCDLFRDLAKNTIGEGGKNVTGTGGTVIILYFAGNALDAPRHITSARRKKFANYLAREQLFHCSTH